MNKLSNIETPEPEIIRSEFGKHEGRIIEKISIRFKGQMNFSILNFGAIITDIHTPDKYGVLDNIVLSYDHAEEYINDNYYIGAIIGRYANRIKKGQFKLGGETIQLSQNDKGHHLHGGFFGFNKVFWDVEGINKKSSGIVEIHLSHHSEKDSEGYPGNLKVNALFKIGPQNIEIEISGLSDQDSIFNPTHHSYFNLSGSVNKNISDHLLFINSEKIVEVDSEGIPSGIFKQIKGTHFDFSVPREVKECYDHCYVLHSKEDKVTLTESVSGRQLKIRTNCPGLQLYTANDFPDEDSFAFKKHHSICLEPQYFPDSPNHPIFPDASIKSGDNRKFICSYKFDII